MVISVLGAGMIGEALMSGLLHGGHKPEDLLFTTRRADRAQQLTDKYGVKAVETEEAVEPADVLVVAVEPQDIDATLDDLSIGMTAHKLLVTVCAGLPTALFERRIGEPSQHCPGRGLRISSTSSKRWSTPVSGSACRERSPKS